MSACDSDFRFSLGHKLSRDSDFDSDHDTLTGENRPLVLLHAQTFPSERHPATELSHHELLKIPTPVLILG